MKQPQIPGQSKGCFLVSIQLIMAIFLVITVTAIVGIITSIPLTNRYCYTRAASRIGVPATNSTEAYDAIVSYLRSNIQTGTSEDNVLTILRRISTIDVREQRAIVLKEGRLTQVGVIEEVTLDCGICETIRIYITFTQDHKLFDWYIFTMDGGKIGPVD
jgi:hypothetical protein